MTRRLASCIDARADEAIACNAMHTARTLSGLLRLDVEQVMDAWKDQRWACGP